MKLAIIHPFILGRESFNYDAIKEGVPGAEETLINLACKFASRGIKTTIYTHTKCRIYYAEGVCWKDLSNLKEMENDDILWSWSDNAEIANSYSKHWPTTTLKLFRFVNQSTDENLERLLNNYDVCIGQSQWLNNRYRQLNAKNQFIVANGINASSFNDPRIFGRKNSGQLFYGSDYDRGLIHLLEFWPIIKRIRPEAKLYVCYGWDIFDAKMQRERNNNKSTSSLAMMEKFREYINRLLMQKDITHLGRISHDEVNRIMKESQYWFYPCIFPENCSTLSIKAGASGLIPATVSSGGLVETVHNEYRTEQSLWQSSEMGTQEEIELAIKQWKKKVIKLLCMDDFNCALSDAIRKRKEILVNNDYDIIAGRIIEFLNERVG